jgi:hypothetical protein
MRRFNFKLDKYFSVMKKLTALFVVSMFFPFVVAHSSHGHIEDTNQSSEPSQQSEQIEFSQLSLFYTQETIWFLAEIFALIGATFFGARHYFRKSESSSLKEFIREDIV